MLLCGGIDHAIEIKTVDQIVLSLGIEISTDDFFDSHYLVRNLASLFGIPTERMRVPKIVAGSTVVDIEIATVDKCGEDFASKYANGDACGPHGVCRAGMCVCDTDWPRLRHERDCLTYPNISNA